MTSATSTPDFPAHPQDGFQIIQDLPDERQLIWTYNKALNQWNSQFIIPKDAATKGWVLEQQYLQAPLTVRDFSKDVATTEYVDGAIAAAIAPSTYSVVATSLEKSRTVSGACKYCCSSTHPLVAASLGIMN